VTWYNPLSRSDLLIPGEEDIATWRSHNISEKHYRELARLAWDISAELAVFLPDRLPALLFVAFCLFGLCSVHDTGQGGSFRVSFLEFLEQNFYGPGAISVIQTVKPKHQSFITLSH